MDLLNRMAASANAEIYDDKATRDFIDGAPHIKHASLRRFYKSLYSDVFDTAKATTPVVRVLDLGAGEGSVTRQFLRLGANVTAVDISASQLNELRKKCQNDAQSLHVVQNDINEFLETAEEKYDIIIFSAFLHHVPDYLGMISNATKFLHENGQICVFQEPLRFDSLSKPVKWFNNIAYLCWRMFKGDVFGGLKRRYLRCKGQYKEIVADQADYHCIRNGMDQTAMLELFRGLGMTCEVKTYFSTQSRLFQKLGEIMRVKNTFSIIAKR